MSRYGHYGHLFERLLRTSDDEVWDTYFPVDGDLPTDEMLSAYKVCLSGKASPASASVCLARLHPQVHLAVRPPKAFNFQALWVQALSSPSGCHATQSCRFQALRVRARTSPFFSVSPALTIRKLLVLFCVQNKIWSLFHAHTHIALLSVSLALNSIT
jgi:hypothetical protein